MPIVVKCKRGVGDKEADSLNAPLCINETLAMQRGKRFLDDPEQGGYYTTITRNIKTPHKTVIKPGVFVNIKNFRLGIQSAVAKCISYKIEITPASVLGAGVYQEFTHE
jgi:hypothetical protein